MSNLEKAALATGSMDTLDLQETQKKIAADAAVERDALRSKYKTILDVVDKANASTNLVFDLIELTVREMRKLGIVGYILIGVVGVLLLLFVVMPMFSGIVKLSPLDWLVIIMSIVIYCLISYLKKKII